MTYAESLRKQANELRSASRAVLSDPLLSLKAALGDLQSETDLARLKQRLAGIADGLPQMSFIHLVTAVTGFVTANVYEALADQSEYLVQQGALRKVSDRLRENARINAALRTAAATGDWDEFDKLAAGITASAGNPSGQSEPSTGTSGTGTSDQT